MSAASHAVGWTGFAFFSCVAVFQVVQSVFYARARIDEELTDYAKRSVLFVFTLAWLYPLACLNRLSVLSAGGSDVSVSLVLFNALVWAVGTVQFLAASPAPDSQKKNLYVLRALAAGLVVIIGVAAFLSSATRFCVLFAVLQLAGVFAWHFMSAGLKRDDLMTICSAQSPRLVLLYVAFALVGLLALIVGMLSAGYADILPHSVTLAMMLVCHIALVAIVTLADHSAAGHPESQTVSGSPASLPHPLDDAPSGADLLH